MFGEPYATTMGCKISAKLDKVAHKEEDSFQLHRAILLANENGISLYNTSPAIDLENASIKAAGKTNEAVVEFGINTVGLFKLFVYLNDRLFKDIFFIESRKGKLQSVEEQLSTTQHSVVSNDTGLNSSKTNAFVKRPKSSFRLSSNVFVKKDNRIVIKTGSTQPTKKADTISGEQKRASIKDILANNKGKLEKYLKGKKTVLPSIKRAI